PASRSARGMIPLDPHCHKTPFCGGICYLFSSQRRLHGITAVKLQSRQVFSIIEKKASNGII
ncbi:MAG: hypothetical protein IJE57_01700, partial [Anaerotignum sp.]|nr:hypothetical protein [Anaerotignum sp.]